MSMQNGHSLRESDERLRLAVEAMGLGTYDYDVQRDEALWSHRLCELVQLPCDGPVGRELILSLIHPDDRRRFAALVENSFDPRGPGRYEVEYRIQRPDSELRWFRDTGRTYFEGEGEQRRPVRVVGTVQDITDRRRTEEALRESEARFRAAVEAVSSLLWTNSPDGTMEGEQPGWAAFTGQSPEEYQGYGWARAVHPEDAQPTIDAWNRAVAERRTFIFEHRVRRRDGQWRLCSIRAVPVFDESGAIREWVGVHTDITDQRAAEQTLQRSEERWNAAIEHLGEGAIIATEAEQVIYWNPAARRMHGLTSQQDGIGPLQETSLTFQLWTPDGSRMLSLDEWPMRRIKRGKPVDHLELRLRRPDQGWERIVSYSGAMVTTHGGERLIFLSVYDLTEQRRAEQALRKSEERSRAFTSATSDAVYAMSPDWKEMLHLRGRGFIADTHKPSRTWLDKYIHPDDQPRVTAAIERAVRTRSIFELDHRIIRADGSLGWVHSRAVPILDDRGEIVEWFGAASDVTQRKMAERALAQSEHRLSTILQATPAMVYLVGRDARFLHINRWFEELIGFKAEAIRGRSLFDVFPEEIARQFEENNRTAMAAGRAVEFEETALFPDGEHYYASVKAPIMGDDGQPLGIVGVSTDITERRKMEAELRHHREHLERLIAERTAELEASQQRLRLSERMSALGTLAAGLGHDMRNILMPMRSWIEELESMALPQPAAHAAQSLRRSTEYLRNLTSGLRSLSVDAETAAAIPAATSLESWWHEAGPICTAGLPRGVKLHTPDVRALPPVAIPPHALTQAVFNLVQNAGDALRDSGYGNVWIIATPADAAVRLSIRDDGPGMTPEVRRRCMEPFFTTKVRGRGTGLGLSIVHGVLRASGASLDLDSEPGRGTTFTLTLPLAVERPVGRPTAAVTLSNARLAALAQSVLSGLGVDAAPHPTPVPPTADLWIVDASVPAAELLRFITHGDADRSGPQPESGPEPTRRVVRLADPLHLDPSIIEVPAAGPSDLRLILTQVVAANV